MDAVSQESTTLTWIYTNILLLTGGFGGASRGGRGGGRGGFGGDRGGRGGARMSNI